MNNIPEYAIGKGQFVEFSRKLELSIQPFDVRSLCPHGIVPLGSTIEDLKFPRRLCGHLTPISFSLPCKQKININQTMAKRAPCISMIHDAEQTIIYP